MGHRKRHSTCTSALILVGMNSGEGGLLLYPLVGGKLKKREVILGIGFVNPSLNRKFIIYPKSS